MKRWAIAVITVSLAIGFFAYRATAETEISVMSQSVFPHNGQHYISYSFEAEGDKSNKLQLKQVDISTLNEFSYFIFPYEVTDYTSVETAGALSFPVNIEKNKLYTILMGPVPENALHAETEISLDFNDFQHHFGWEALPLD